MNISKEELELVKAGASRKRKQIEGLEKNCLEHLTDFGSFFISENIDKVSKKLETICGTSTPMLKLPMEPAKIAYIGLSVIMSYLEDETKIFSLALRIGNLVELELNASNIKLPDMESREALKLWIKKSEEYKKLKREYKVRLGQAFLIAVSKATDYISLYKKQIGPRVYAVVSPSEVFYEIQTSVNENSMFDSPLKRPIESHPVLVDDDLVGGYAFDALARNPCLSSRHEKDKVALLKKEGDIGRIAKVLNRVSSVSYTIDKGVLDVAWKCYTNDICINGILPPKEKRLVFDKKLVQIASPDEEKEIKKKYHIAKELNKSVRGKRLASARTLVIARDFVGKNFYFPGYVDGRGRIYYNGDYLSPQSSDLAKSLLLFSEGKVITEPFFYCVHGANCYGVKGSYDKRCGWVNSNIKRILAVANNPFGRTNLEFWSGADEPWAFLAFCLDMEKYTKSPDTHRSSLRIGIDASSSGLQILSLLSRDRDGCVRTNVLNNGSGAPSDIYMECVKNLDECIREDLVGDLKDNAQYWMQFLIGKNKRNLVKRIVMTTVYSLSRYGLQKYVEEWVREHDVNCPLDKMRYLGSKVAEAVDRTVSGSRGVMNWITKVASILARNNKDIIIVMPSGFVFKNTYRESNQLQIKTTFLGKHYYCRHRRDDDEGKINKGKTVNASVPNLVHAIDANILFDFIESSGPSVMLSVVHDCIYTLPGDIDAVYASIRDAFIRVFSPNLLKDFHKQLTDRYGISLPLPPSYKDDLNIKDIEDSDYLYH